MGGDEDDDEVAPAFTGGTDEDAACGDDDPLLFTFVFAGPVLTM